MTTRTVLSVFFCYLGVLLPGSANLVISEIDLNNSKVEFVNTGDTVTVNMGPYWLCNRVSAPANLRYLQATTLPIDSDNSTALNLRIEPGQVIVLEVPDAFLPDDRGELGLYSSNAFGTRAAMVDYLNYGNSTGVRDFTATLDPAIWVLDTAIDVSAAGPRDSIQLNLGAPGNEVADYSVTRSSLGQPQSLSVALIGDIVISEIDLANSRVELANIGNAEVDLTGYVWNNAATGAPAPARPVSLADLDSANSTSDSLQVPPGGVATFILNASFLPAAGGELGLYNTDNDFNSRDAMVDYLAYGNSNGIRDVVAVLDPVIWVLNTSIDLSGADPGDTIQLNPGEPGEEVAHYSLAPPTIGEAQSIILPTLRITDLGFVDSDTCFIDFEYSGSRALKVTEAADLITFTDVSARTTVASPSATRFEFDVTGDQLYFRLEED